MKEKIKKMRIAHVFGEKSENLFFLSVFLRTLFCLPGDAISMYFGAIKMPYVKYILGSFIGILPGTIAATLLGMSINRVCVVEYMPNLNQALRQPVFKGLRDDVVAEEVQI